jgi:hypothetical protein
MRSNNEARVRINITDGQLGVDIHPAVVARVVVSPRVPACGEVVAVLGPQGDYGASLSPGMAVAVIDRPLRWPWVNSCWLVRSGA